MLRSARVARPVLVVLVVLAALCGPAAAQAVRDCPDCPVLVPLGDGTLMGKFVVTRGEYAVFARDTGLAAKGCTRRSETRWFLDEAASWENPGFAQGDDHPAVCVSWLEATAYTEWLSERTGKSYRLPTIEEATAAAGPPGTTYWWGDDFAAVCRYANAADAAFRTAFPNDPRALVPCDDGYVYTAPVDAFPANAAGLHDAAGNVWQWTNSCLKGDCSNALFRGAGWNVPFPSNFATAYSFGDRIVLRNFVIGFRVLREN